MDCARPHSVFDCLFVQTLPFTLTLPRSNTSFASRSSPLPVAMAEPAKVIWHFYTEGVHANTILSFPGRQHKPVLGDTVYWNATDSLFHRVKRPGYAAYNLSAAGIKVPEVDESLIDKIFADKPYELPKKGPLNYTVCDVNWATDGTTVASLDASVDGAPVAGGSVAFKFSQDHSFILRSAKAVRVEWKDCNALLASTEVTKFLKVRCVHTTRCAVSARPAAHPHDRCCRCLLSFVSGA